MGKRWIKKREFVIYYLLWKKYRDNCVNRGGVLDFVSEIVGSKKTARNIVNVLVKRGFLRRCDTVSYRVISFEEAFMPTVISYVLQRLKRLGKISEYTINGADKSIIVYAGSEKCNKLTSLSDIVKQEGWIIKCVESIS